MANQQDPIPFNEPSIWDYFVSKLKFWVKDQPEPEENNGGDQPENTFSFPWFSSLAVIFALVAQLTLEPSPGRTPWPGVVLYAAAAGCLIAAIYQGEWRLPAIKPDAETSLNTAFRLDFLLIGVLLAILSFLLFGSGVFGFLNLLVWGLSLVFIFLTFWQHSKREKSGWNHFWSRFQVEGWQFKVTRWTVIVLAVIGVILFFNFYRLDSVPPEMVSDQAEKLLDINDILKGHTPVYFPRNTGREVLHFYLTAAYLKVFNLDVSFLNLKTVAVFANLLTLFFIYLLGKEFGNKWVGLGAVLFAGMAYWPLLFTRLALRIPYYPLFVAPVMYFMVR
jgi:hypothetical protein